MFLLLDLLESPCFDILICGEIEKHININVKIGEPVIYVILQPKYSTAYLVLGYFEYHCC